MQPKSWRSFVIPAITILAGTMSCSDSATAPASNLDRAPASARMLYPRLADSSGPALFGAAAVRANRQQAERRAAAGDSSVLLGFIKRDAYLDSLFAVSTQSLGGASFDDASTVTFQKAVILDSGTRPSLARDNGFGGETDVEAFLDYEGDQVKSNADYKTTPHNTLTGDWAPFPENDSPGDLHFGDITSCGGPPANASCLWRHQESKFPLALPTCGIDLWARGNHAAWWSGTSISFFGVYTASIIDPSAQVFSTDIANSDPGVGCEEYDQYTPNPNGGEGDCPYEDQYWWYHNYGDGTGLHLAGSVCIQDGIITII
jgi:hypothetical protein